MIQYRFALTPAATLVDVLRLTAANRGAAYRCPACGESLTPVLPTQSISAHFRHTSAGACSSETYLHNAAKRAFKQAFDFHAKHGGYYVRTPDGDRLRISDVFGMCAIDDVAEGDTRPDLTLTSKHGDHRRVFVEIAVTQRVHWHKALMRYYPTIELAIASEADIEALRADTLDLEAANVTFYDNALDVVPFFSAPLYLTPQQQAYAARLDWAALDAAEPTAPSLMCALLELAALQQDGRPDRRRLAEIRRVYGGM